MVNEYSLKKITIFVFGLLLVSCSRNTAYYYGLDGFGKLQLKKNGQFTLHYFDTGSDSGDYIMRGDTVVLSSINRRGIIEPVDLRSINNECLSKFVYLDVYYSNMALAKKETIEMDVCSSRIILRNCNYKKGQLLIFRLPFIYSLQLTDDIKGDFSVQFDLEGTRSIFFENYRMLKSGKHLLPINWLDDKKFRMTNPNTDLILFKKGKKGAKYYVFAI